MFRVRRDAQASDVGDSKGDRKSGGGKEEFKGASASTHNYIPIDKELEANLARRNFLLRLLIFVENKCAPSLCLFCVSELITFWCC